MSKTIHATVKETGPLTPAETKVLKYLCEGYMRKEISRRVFRSYGCVSKQVESISEKLDAHSAAEIVAKAVAQGLVEIKLVEHAQHQALLKCLLLILLMQHQPFDARNPPRHIRLPVKIARTATTAGGRNHQ